MHHRRASLAPGLSAEARANHRLAAKAHADSVIHHLRLYKHKSATKTAKGKTIGKTKTRKAPKTTKKSTKKKAT